MVSGITEGLNRMQATVSETGEAFVSLTSSVDQLSSAARGDI
jgi:hypothetical protein